MTAVRFVEETVLCAAMSMDPTRINGVDGVRIAALCEHFTGATLHAGFRGWWAWLWSRLHNTNKKIIVIKLLFPHVVGCSKVKCINVMRENLAAVLGKRSTVLKSFSLVPKFPSMFVTKFIRTTLDFCCLQNVSKDGSGWHGTNF